MPGTPLRRVGLLVNRTSGRGRAAALGAALQHQLRTRGHTVVDLPASSAAEALAQARHAVAGRLVDALAVVGGDGTAHVGVNACALTGIPLAILPAGSGNDSARALGLVAGDVAGVAELLASASVRTVDAGRADGQRWWLGVLGAGFDAVVGERVLRMRRLHGRARYVAAVLRELPAFRGIRYTVHVDDARIDTEAMLVAVANGPSFGSGMRVCPDARMDDGRFDVLVLHRVSLVEFLRVFPRVYSGRHVDHPAVEVRRGQRVRLEADGVTAQADGERFGRLPLDLELVAGALQVVAP